MGRHKSASKKQSSSSSRKSKSSSGDSSSRKSGGGALGRLTVGTTVKRLGHPSSGADSDSGDGNSKVVMRLKVGNKTTKLTKTTSPSGDPSSGGSSSGSRTTWAWSADGGDEGGEDTGIKLKWGNEETNIKNPFRPAETSSSSTPSSGDSAAQGGQDSSNPQGATWVSARPTALQPGGPSWVSAQPTALQPGTRESGGDHAHAGHGHGLSPSTDGGAARRKFLDQSKRALDLALARASEAELVSEANAMAAAFDPSDANVDLAEATRLDAQRARARAVAIQNSMRGELPGFKFPTYAVPFDRGSSSMSDGEARNIFSTEKSWPAIKAKYADQPEKMAGLFAYRKKYVDSLINAMRMEYPNLIANAAGSTDLTSDYDVTVSVVGDPKASVAVIATLNDMMRGDFGAESGTVFDTNFYYKAVAMKDNILKDGHFPPGMDTQDAPTNVSALSEPEQLRPATSGSKQAYDRDQDVLALMKIARYSQSPGGKTPDGWTAFKEQTLSSLAAQHGGDTHHAAVEEASSRFAEAEKKVAEFKEETDARMLSMGFDPSKDPHDMSDDERGRFEDAMLKVNNLGYLDRLALVADKEAEESALIKAVADATTQQARDEAWQKLNDVRRDIYSLRGDSLYFAAEAYHSTGALVHIVEGIQGGGKINAPLELLLQSFNEQFGDFMKDAGHYTDDGEFFYRSAKYAGRMGVAMRDYFMKANGLTPEMLKAAGLTVDEAMTGTPAALAALGQGSLPFKMTPSQQHAYSMLEVMTNNTSKYLLAIRKGVSKDSGENMQDWYTRLTPDQKRFWAARYADMFAGAKTKGDLVKALRDLAQGFNAAARDFNDSTYAARQPVPVQLAAPQPRGQDMQGAAPPGEKKQPFPPRARGSMN